MSSFLLSSEGSGRATAYLESPKIITFQGRTHVAWLDSPPEGFRIRVRTLEHSTGLWSKPVTVGEAVDNHGGPALTIDAEGFLHIVYYSHHHPFRYHRSTRPNDASAWEPMEQFGTDLTYPTLLCARDGTLILSARRSHEKQPWELELWRRPPGGGWTRGPAILRSRFTNYSQFAASMAWAPDHHRLYFSFRLYEMPDHPDKRALTSVGCITSPDGGETWTRLDGTPLALPATADDVDAIATCDSSDDRIADVGSMAVSPDGAPHIVYSVKTQERADAFLATSIVSGVWQHVRLNPFLPAALSDWAIVLQGGVVFDGAGRANVVTTVMKLKAGDESWGHTSTELARLTERGDRAGFDGRLLTEPNATEPRWLPNLERPTGFNEVPAHPGVVFTAGPAGAGLGDMLRNKVWWKTLSEL